jgi:citrate:succinate antiporter/L-tartrate/succinate antiporter
MGVSVWKSVLPLIVWLTLTLVPHPAGLTASAWRYHALFVGVIVALVLEPIPAPAVGMVGVAVATALRYVAPKPEDAVKWGLSGFSDNTVWLIFGALVFSTGYTKTGLGRRIALLLVRTLGRRTLGLGYAVMLADLLIAPVMPSNTGRSAGVIFPIVRSIPGLYGSEPGPTARRIGAYLMWTAFATTAVTSSLFLTALAPNLLALGVIVRETNIEISWTQWLLGFLPVGLALLVPLPVLVYLIYPPEVRSSPEVPAWARAELARMGRVKAKEAVMGILMLVAVYLWVCGTGWINATTVILVIVAIMLVARIVDWSDVVGNRAAWDMLFYFATLLTLADGLNRLGVITWVASGVSRFLTGYPPLFVMAVLVAFFFLVHYLFASLTAHASAVLPPLLATGMAIEGMPGRTFVLLLAYGLGLMGVITPYATGPAFAYYGSGFITRKEFWRLGLVFGLLFLTALLGVGMPYLLWLNGASPAVK